MARIKEYNTEIGATADIGGRRAHTGDFFQPGNDGSGLIQAADIMADVVQRQEVSEVRARMAEVDAELTVDLKTRADAGELGDATFAETFNADAADRIAKIGDNVRTPAGRAAYQERAAATSAHFVKASGLYQADSMGKKAVLDYSRALDANRNILVRDPSRFDDVMQANDMAIGDRNGPYANLPAAARAKLAEDSREQLALSAVQGEIAQNPDVALARLNKGAWDSHLDADKTVTLKRSAESAIHARLVESDRLERAAAKARADAERKTEDSYFARFVKDPTSLSAVEIANSNLNPDDKWKWYGRISTGDKPMKTDAGVFKDLFERIHLPPDDPRAITDEKQLDPHFGNGVAPDSLNFLRTEISGRRTPEGMIESEMKKRMFDTAKSALSGSNSLLGIRDPKGDEQLQRYMAYFLPEYDKQRKAGKSAVELLDPGSPEYLGKAIQQYKRPWDDVLRDSFPAPDGSRKDYKSAAEVTADYQAGKISKGKAGEILRQKGWAK